MARRRKGSNGMVFLIVVIALSIAAILCLEGYKAYRELEKKEAELAQKQELVEDERKKTEELENEIKYHRTEEYIEEKARELGLRRSDEILIIPEEGNPG